MMLAADVYDVSPAASGVAILRDRGADPWVVDFGAPEQEEGGLERTLADRTAASGPGSGSASSSPPAPPLASRAAWRRPIGYGVPGREGVEVTVVAVTLGRGATLDARGIVEALRGVAHKPAVVHVVDEIPVTTWYRPLTSPPRAAGLPPAGDRAWARDARGAYRPLTESALRRLRR